MKKKSWADVQMAITAISITATVGLWSMFSGPERAKALAKAQEAAQATEPPMPTEVVEPTATAMPVATELAYMPVKVIYGGTPPAPKAVSIVSAPSTTGSTKTNKPSGNNNKKPGNNSGSGNNTAAS